jgi:hypothetical protein
MRKTAVCLLAFIFFQPAGLALAEECPAAKEWFATAGAPAPSNAEPKRGIDCAFYQLAWQTFLYVTDQINGSPRLLSYETYSDVFGSDPNSGLLAPALSQTKLLTAMERLNRPLVLAPRLQKSGQDIDAEDILQAGSSAILIDQDGHVVFYNIFMNPVFSGFVRQNKYNDVSKLIAVPPDQELPVGAVEFKAAWQLVDKDVLPGDRIVREVQVPWLIDNGSGKLKVDDKRPLRKVTVALIGLHVVMRPVGHPEMIWATFEYDRNAPSTVGNPSDSASSCVNPSETRNDALQDDGKPYLLFATGDSSPGIRKPTSIVIKDATAQIFQPMPKTSIARVFPFSGCSPARDPGQAITEIDPAIVALNKSAKGQIKDASRKNYSLIGAVWLDEPGNPNDNRGFKKERSFEDFELGGENRLSSASMESFTQISSPNCFSCHDTTAKGKLPAMRLGVSHIFQRFSATKK